jgi:hypothetical protein
MVLRFHRLDLSLERESTMVWNISQLQYVRSLCLVTVKRESISFSA